MVLLTYAPPPACQREGSRRPLVTSEKSSKKGKETAEVRALLNGEVGCVGPMGKPTNCACVSGAKATAKTSTKAITNLLSLPSDLRRQWLALSVLCILLLTLLKLFILLLRLRIRLPDYPYIYHITYSNFIACPCFGVLSDNCSGGFAGVVYRHNEASLQAGSL